MSRLISAIGVILVIGLTQQSMGFKWIPSKYYHRITRDAIKLTNSTYVGRAFHCNLLLPAEVHNRTHAVILHDDQQIVKNKFEVLIASEHCEWEEFSDISKVSPDVVLGGSAWNNEPIYIAKTTNKADSQTHIASLLIESNRVITWGRYRKVFALNCDVKTTWEDKDRHGLQEHVILGGEEDGLGYFIGRLLGPSSWISAKVFPKNGSALAQYGEVQIEADFSQVLIDDRDLYVWHKSKFGKIIDYPVVVGQAESGELRYIVQLDGETTYRLASELRRHPDYLVLVRNERF